MSRKQTLVLSLVLSFSIAAAAAPPSGIVTTVAGQPGVAGYWDGPASDAMFTHPTWLDVAVGNKPPTCDEGKTGEIFVVDRMNGLVRRISESGFVSTVNVGRSAFVGGPVVTPIPLNFDSAFGGGILVEPPGAGCGCDVYARSLFIASTGANQLLLVSPKGALANRDDWSTILGTGEAGGRDGGSETQAQFNKPTGIALALNGDKPTSIPQNRKVYVADSGNHTIRRINWTLSFEACPQGRGVSTLAGAAGQPGSADGVGSAARFNTPRGIAVAPDGTLYVTDAGNHTVRRITPDGIVTTVAGVPGVAGSDDTSEHAERHRRQ